MDSNPQHCETIRYDSVMCRDYHQSEPFDCHNTQTLRSRVCDKRWPNNITSVHRIQLTAACTTNFMSYPSITRECHEFIGNSVFYVDILRIFLVCKMFPANDGFVIAKSRIFLPFFLLNNLLGPSRWPHHFMACTTVYASVRRKRIRCTPTAHSADERRE